MFNNKSNESHEPCGLGISQLRNLSDETVMAHLKQGHDDALAVLFERYHRLVFSIAIKILHDEGEAEDVTQNVFLEVFRNAVQFDPQKGSTKAWLLQYAYHRSFNRLRYLKVRGLQRDFEVNSRDNQYLLSRLLFKYEYGENVGDVFNMRPYYDQITVASIRDAAQMYLNTNRYVKVTLLPQQ